MKSSEMVEETTHTPKISWLSTLLGRFKNVLTVYQRLILIIVIGFLLRVSMFIIWIPGTRVYMGDPYRYLARTESILDGDIPYRDFTDTKPPLWSYSLALWFKLLGKEPTITGIKVFILIFSMLDILLIYLIVQKLFSEKEALITALFFALNPLDIFNSMICGRYDAVPLFFLLLSFYYLQKMKWKLSALFLGIAIMFKYVAGLFIIPYTIYLHYQRKTEKENKGRKARPLIAFIKDKNVLGYVLLVFSICFVISLPFLIIDWHDYFYNTLDFAHSPRPGISLYGVFSHALIYYHPELDGIRDFGTIELLLEFGLLLYVTKMVLKEKKSLENTEFVFIAFLWTTLIISLSMTAKPQYFEYSMPWIGILLAKSYQKNTQNPNRHTLLIVSTAFIPLAVVLSYMLYANYFELSPASLYYTGYALGVIFLDLLIFYVLIKFYLIFIKKQ